MPGDDPPDFLLTIGRDRHTWLELTDLYYSNDEGKYDSQPRERFPVEVFSYGGPADQVTNRFFTQLAGKLSKSSYAETAKRLGKGILLLTCRSCTFDENDLAQIKDGLEVFSAYNDQQLFEVAYFEYQLNLEDFYMVVYPKDRVGEVEKAQRNSNAVWLTR